MEQPGPAALTASLNTEPHILLLPGLTFPYTLGACNDECISCNALHWKEERTLEDSRRNRSIYSICCQKGQVDLPMSDPLTPTVPNWMKDLLTNKTDHLGSKNFQRSIRAYNNSISFTSLGTTFKQKNNGPGGPNVFTIKGNLGHRIGDIIPSDGESPKFAQIFVVGDGGEAEVHSRMRAATSSSTDTPINAISMDPQIVKCLQDFMYEHNPYAKAFKSASEIALRNCATKLVFTSVKYSGKDNKRYNEPTVDEIGFIVSGSGLIKDKRKIQLTTHSGQLQYISDLHSAYFPLRYPLFFLYGSQQWEPTYRASLGKCRKVSQLEWFAYLLFVRRETFSSILLGRSLFQELLVDMYICVERSRLNWFKNNQDKLQIQIYNGIVESFESQDSGTGKRIVLPSTFIGGPRSLSQLFQDAMALVREFGAPSLFLTMTANSNWPEIKSEIPEGDDPSNHPTVIARVFHEKSKEFLRQLLKMNRLGKVVSYVYTVEFQKRGLPHIHMMLTLDESSRPATPADFDALVCAELPNKEEEPKLHAIVTRCMLHGPCQGRTCYIKGKCKYRYPKDFRNETEFVEGSYPAYQRRETGITVTKGKKTFDSRDVVPYNKFLSLYFDCHINVEVAVGIEAVKYIYKYITKGHDRSYLALEDQDETKKFIDARYISPPEAAWRIFQYDMSDRYPAVQRLALHDETARKLKFKKAKGGIAEVDSGEPGTTTLNEFFRACANNLSALGHQAKDLTYQEFPRYFWWADGKEWRPRIRPTETVGRLHFISIHQGERYYIRLLLLHKRGPISFRDLRTIGGHLYNTFREAADAMGLLLNDNHYNQALTEASKFKTGFELRLMFTLILVYSPPANPGALLTNHMKALGDDVKVLLQRRFSTDKAGLDEIEAYTLWLLREHLTEMGKTFHSVGLAISPTQRSKIEVYDKDPEEAFDLIEASNRVVINRDLFTKEQETFFAQVQFALSERLSRMFFLNGPGGTGKTFVLNTIIDAVKSDHKTVVVVASTGVAALLLSTGQTAHSAFKLPINLGSETTCAIEEGSAQARRLLAADLIIWDEIVTMHWHAIDAVDKLFQKLSLCSKPFGGKCVLFSGDFRQTLPVVAEEQTPPSEHATLKSSPLWPRLKRYALSENMRLVTGRDGGSEVDIRAFGRELLDIGEGRFQDGFASRINFKCVEVMDTLSPVKLISEGVRRIYDDIGGQVRKSETERIAYLSSRCILTPLNADSWEINRFVLHLMGQPIMVSLSVDRPDEEAVDTLPEESLNKLEFPGFPEHKLHLCLGMPIMLLRNLNITQGLCNGTRLMVTRLTDRTIGAKFLTGPRKGRDVTLPKILLRHEGEAKAKVSFYRHQFPVVSCFAMTINKSQGQTLGKVVVMLKSQVFAHGQLYVGLSRVTHPNNLLVVQLGATKTVTNVVNKELFQ